MADQFRFHTIEALRDLSLEELRALWELVPTERQRAYKAAYEKEVRNAGAAGSDELEMQVTHELVKHYEAAALTPVGSRWVKTPGRVQEAARQNEEPDADAGSQSGKPPTPNKFVVTGGLLMVLFLFAVIFMRGGNSEATAETAAGTNAVPTATWTPTPEVSPTPTPLALEAQDDVIRGGDTGRAAAYPVGLRVTGADAFPRVWVVQQRRVEMSEWVYDQNPDTASFVAGMSVRPVIGIPWSEENAAWFERIGNGAVFNLQMNTGAVLQFAFASKTHVLRSDTSIFRQVSPGLVLLLIGEKDEAGLPTAARVLITANYLPEQELSRQNELAAGLSGVRSGRIGEPLLFGEPETGAVIVLREMRTVTEIPGIPLEQQYLLLDFEISAGTETLDTSLWRLEAVDGSGQVYSPGNTTGYLNYGSLPRELPALATFPASVGYIVPRQFHGRWQLIDQEDHTIEILLEPETPAVETRFSHVDVQVKAITYTEGQVITKLRVYNGGSETLDLDADDVWLALGYIPRPAGPRVPAEQLPAFGLLPEQAADLTLIWRWEGEPYATFGVGDYHFALEMAES